MSRLSRRGKTVIFSIHQPRYSIFKQFDHLTLMHKGEMVYSGPADHSVEYFTVLGMCIRYKKCHTLLMLGGGGGFMHSCTCFCTGYQMDSFSNPADFLMDITNGEAVSTLVTPSTGTQNTLSTRTELGWVQVV